MRKAIMVSSAISALLTLSTLTVFSQNTTVTGSVKNSNTNEPIPAVSVTVKGNTFGTYTDERGNFRLNTSETPPFTVVISSVGFAEKEIAVDNTAQTITVELSPTYTLGEEIVVAASRTPERILESPVSIERISAANIRNAPATSYYDVLGNVKGVDLTTASLTFKTVTTRGFNISGNTRFNQIVDGMDNQAPGLNFSVGNIIGLTELEVESMELLEGASSALYGPGGMNGTLIINSKSPFKYQGVSAQVREGIMHIDDPYRDVSPYHDLTFRWGEKISDKFAFKVGAQYILAKDWLAYDTSNYIGAPGTKSASVIPGTRYSDPNYNGVNVYGDETSLDINGAATPFLLGATGGDPTAIAAISPFLASPLPVSRTGYLESDVVPEKTINFKVSGGLYYRIKPELELSLVGFFGQGNSVYTGSDRYALKDLQIGQYKLELRSNHWFLRAYTTQENAGESYNATVTSQLFNEAWKPSFNPLDPANSWYPQFSGALVGGSLAIYAPVYQETLTATGDPAQANAAAQAAVAQNQTALLYSARLFADQGRPVAGTQEFDQLFDAVRLKPIPEGGKFLDKSDLYMTEGQYNLTDVLKVGESENRLEVLTGANFKRYVLNSEGTLFADEPGNPINIDEWGAYLQLSQRLFNDVLKLTASGRYDKNENFKGRFTPRVSAVISVAKDQNLRLSYQTAYRFPTTQNQWIDLLIGGGVRLIGGLPELKDKYNFSTNPVYALESFYAFSATGDPSLLQVQNFDDYKPESANSYEIGYKGLINNKLLIDAYAYYAKYRDFLGRITVVQSSDGTPVGLATPNIISVAVNTSTEVTTNGWGLSFDYLLPNNFFINGNVFSDLIHDVPADFVSYFNTPKYRFNAGFGSNGLGKAKRFGFNILYRWQDAFFYESDFRQGNVSAFATLDAQVNYKLPPQKLMFKLGGTNITNHYYRNAFGNPYIGGLYYISIGYNVF